MSESQECLTIITEILPHFEKETFEINLAATLKFANKMRNGLPMNWLNI